jgi:hypothetical protein
MILLISIWRGGRESTRPCCYRAASRIDSMWSYRRESTRPCCYRAASRIDSMRSFRCVIEGGWNRIESIESRGRRWRERTRGMTRWRSQEWRECSRWSYSRTVKWLVDRWSGVGWVDWVTCRPTRVTLTQVRTDWVWPHWYHTSIWD